MKVQIGLSTLSDQELVAIGEEFRHHDSGDLERRSPRLFISLFAALVGEILGRKSVVQTHIDSFDVPLAGAESSEILAELEYVGMWCACHAVGLASYPALSDLFRNLSIELGKAHQLYLGTTVAAEAVVAGTPAPDAKPIPGLYKSQRRVFRQLLKTTGCANMNMS